MNPVVQVVNSYKTYRLEKKDLNRLKKVRLINGSGNINQCVGHRMCIMQAVSLVSVQSDYDLEAKKKELGWEGSYGYTDTPICVSSALTDYLIAINDDHLTDRERARLKSIIPLVLNTAPIKVKEYKTKPPEEFPDRGNKEYMKAEVERRKILFPEDWQHCAEIPERTIKEHLRVIREAADLFRTAPGLVDELL